MIKKISTFLKTHRFQTIIFAIISVLAVALAVYLINKDPDGYPDLTTTVILSSGEYEMTFDEALFLTKNKQAYYEAYYLSSGVDLDWNIDYEDGNTFQQVVLDESLDFAKEIFLFSEYAKANGITLTDSELTYIDDQVSIFLSKSGDKVVEATRANSDVLKRVYTRTAYHDKLCEQIYKDADLTVNRDELKQCLVAAVELGPKYFDSPKETAEAIMNRVNKGEVITEVAEIYDTKAVKGNVGKGDMDGNALEQLCLSLKNGECKITEIDGTYFVVYCYLAYDEDATDLAVENKLEELKAAAVKTYYDNLLKEMPVEVNNDAWSTINFNDVIFTEEDLETQETLIPETA